MSRREVEPSTVLGRRIRQLRKEHGMTQEALARRADMSTKGMRELERGITTDPHYSTLCRVARGLDVALIVLLWGLEEPTGGPGQW